MNNRQEQFKGEQDEILKRVGNILDVYFNKSSMGDINKDEFMENHEKIVHLGNILREKGFETQYFILWHKLIGSGIEGLEHLTGSFDTPDRDIEKFILETFIKYT